MIRLGELAAAVVNEMAVARTQAALFGKQMAADFKGHEVLGQIPIPLFEVGNAEISLPFAVASAKAEPAQPPPGLFGPSDLAAAANAAAKGLLAQETVKKAFSAWPNMQTSWRRTTAAALSKRLAGAGELPLEAAAPLFGALAKNAYLLAMIERAAKAVPQTRPPDRGRPPGDPLPKMMEGLKAGWPDLVESEAGRLLKEELEKRIAKQGEKEKRKPVRPGEDQPVGAVYVEVDAEALQQAKGVATLKLQIEEGQPTRMTIGETEDGGNG